MLDPQSTGAPPNEYTKLAAELIVDGSEGPDDEAHRGRHERGVHQELSFAELVDLWHQQHSVAMHKERLYVPSSLAVLVGTVLGWKDVTPLVVLLGAIVSIGLYVQLVLIMNDFAARQDRFFTKMREYRRDILPVMFGPAAIAVKADLPFHGPPTVQRRLRAPFIGVLLVVWAGLFFAKLGVFKDYLS